MGIEELETFAEGPFAEMAGSAGLARAAGALATAAEAMTPEGIAVGLLAAGAASTFTGMQSMTNSAKRVKRMFDDRFRPKRLLEDFQSSLSPAQKKRRTQAEPLMPRRPSKKAPKARRATKRRVAKRGPTGKRKVTRKVTKRKTSTIRKNVKHKVQPHGAGERNDVMYMGFQHHGGRDNLIQVVVDSMLRKYLDKVKINIDNPDVVLPVAASVPSASRMQLIYQATDYTTGVLAGGILGTNVDLTLVTYKALVDLVMTEIRSQYNTDRRVPVQMNVYNSSNDIVYKDRRLSDAIVNPVVTMKLNMRNITPNDTQGDNDRFALDTNPIQGKMYTFNGDIPMVKNTLLADAVHSTAYAKFMDAFQEKGICGQSLANTDVIFQANNVMNTPPAGSSIWTNCRKTLNVALAPGGAAGHVMRFSYKGTFKKLLKQIYGGIYEYQRIGGCTWFGFEQKYSSKGGAGAPHDLIRIEYDVHTSMTCGTRLAPPERSPATVDEQQLDY